MTTTTLNIPRSQAAPWWEIVLVMAIYLTLAQLFPGMREILAIPLVLYMVVESILRHRTRAENGFGFRNILSGLRQNIGWVLLASIASQALTILGEKYLLPDIFTHIFGRVPYDISSLTVSLFVSIAIATFLEELLFRALFQNRLSAFVSPAVAVGIVSLVFAFAHFSPGPALIVFFDLLGVFTDSIIFGIIFQRSKNVFVAWIPHFLADIFAIILLIWVR